MHVKGTKQSRTKNPQPAKQESSSTDWQPKVGDIIRHPEEGDCVVSKVYLRDGQTVVDLADTIGVLDDGRAVPLHKLRYLCRRQEHGKRLLVKKNAGEGEPEPKAKGRKEVSPAPQPKQPPTAPPEDEDDDEIDDLLDEGGEEDRHSAPKAKHSAPPPEADQCRELRERFPAGSAVRHYRKRYTVQDIRKDGMLLLDDGDGGRKVANPEEVRLVSYDVAKAKRYWKWAREEWGFVMAAKGLKMLDLEERAFLGTLIDWAFLKVHPLTLESNDGWFYLTVKTLQNLTGFGRSRQDRLLERLEELKLIKKGIKYSRKRNPAGGWLSDIKRIIRINFDAIRETVPENLLHNQGQGQADDDESLEG